MRIQTALASLLALVAAVPAAAQQTGTPAANWHTRFDRAGAPDSSLQIVPMGGGFHFTSNARGAGVAWQPSQTAHGNFTAELDATLEPTEHQEGYGLILGGRDLDGPSQAYLYFLVRRDGQFLIKHRAGDATDNILAWTPSDAIVKQEGTTPAHNVLRVQARADSVVFLINGQRVDAVARSAAAVDGIVGIRINHHLSVHVAHLDVRPTS